MSVISAMMEDMNLTQDDKEWIRLFQELARDVVQKAYGQKGIDGLTEDMNATALAARIGLDVTMLNKESPLLYALWVVLLQVLMETLRREDFKYQTMDAFMETYGGKFDNEAESERINLLNTANWMNVLFHIITARKNKGLAIQIVPKIVEGWDAKYVTGSGQTKSTQHRVHIFETEGNTKANQRGKAKLLQQQVQQHQQQLLQQQLNNAGAKRKGAAVANGKRSAAAISDSLNGNGSKKRKQNAAAAAVLPLNGSSLTLFPTPVGSVSESRQLRQERNNSSSNNSSSSSNSSRRSGVFSLPESFSDSSVHGETDNENEPEKLHKDVKKALKTFTAFGVSRDESIFGLGSSHLARNNSFTLNAGGLSANAEQQLSIPSDYQRGYTWTEINVPDGAATTAEELGAAECLRMLAGPFPQMQMQQIPPQLQQQMQQQQFPQQMQQQQQLLPLPMLPPSSMNMQHPLLAMRGFNSMDLSSSNSSASMPPPLPQQQQQQHTFYSNPTIESTAPVAAPAAVAGPLGADSINNIFAGYTI